MTATYVSFAIALAVASTALLVIATVVLRKRKPVSPVAVYNASIAAGVLLIGFGVGLWHSAAAGMVATGSLMLVLTIYILERTRRAR